MTDLRTLEWDYARKALDRCRSAIGASDPFRALCALRTADFHAGRATMIPAGDGSVRLDAAAERDEFEPNADSNG